MVCGPSPQQISPPTTIAAQGAAAIIQYEDDVGYPLEAQVSKRGPSRE